MKKETKERLEIDENDIKAVYHFTLCKFTTTSDSFIGNNSFVGLKDVTRVNKTNDIISLQESEQRVATEIFTELLKIAAAGEYEDMRREVENLKHQYDI